MDQYIKQLLLLYSKVILPKFGAIVIANEETGELMFNEYLTYDDGKLSELLEKESTMDLQAAKNSVAKYIRELELLLNKGETYSIFKLGEFRKSKDGSVIFEGNLKTGGPSASDVSSGPSPTPPVVPVKTSTTKDDKLDKSEAKKEVTEKQQEEKKVSKEKEEIKPKAEKIVPKVEVKKEKNTEQSKEAPQSNKDKVVPPIKKVVATPTPRPSEKVTEPIKTKKNTYVEKPKVTDGSPVVEPVKKEEVPPVIVEEKKRRRGFLFWFLLLLFLIILIGSICVVTNYEKVEHYLGWNNIENTEQESAEQKQNEKDAALAEEERKRNDELNQQLLDSKEDSINKTTLEVGTSDSETPMETIDQPVEDENALNTSGVEETMPVSNSSGNHHIVIGCFSEKSNASGLVNKYKQKGYDAKIISQLGGLYFVAAQSYPTFSEAKSELSKIRQDIDGAWLFKQ